MPGHESRPRIGARWVMLSLLFVMSGLAYVQRINIQVAAETMMPALGISLVQMGWVFAAFNWAYALFQVPGGLLGVRFGFHRPLLAIGIAWAVLTLLTGVMPGTLLRSSTAIVAGLIALRFLFGVVQAPVYPLQGGVIEAWFPRGGWALPNALITTGLSLGSAAATPACAWLMDRFGWRAAFTFLAPLGLPLLLLWWWYARDDPATHRGVGAAELATIRAGRSSAPTRAGASWRKVLSEPRLLLLALSYFSSNYLYYVFFQWLFLYLVRERGFSILASGLLASLPWVVSSVATAVGGGVCDLLCRRIGARWGCRTPCLFALPLAAVLLWVGAYAHGPILAVTCLTLCFSLQQFTDGPYWAAATYIAGTETAAATGVLNTGGNLPGILTGIVVPVLIARLGWTAALASGSAFALLAAALWLVIDVERPLARAAASS